MKENKEDFVKDAIERGVPDYTADSLARYVFDGIMPGGFLTAVLENNLMEAFGQADNANSSAMKEIVTFIYNCVPSHCHGTSKKVCAWMEERQRDRTAC